MNDAHDLRVAARDRRKRSIAGQARRAVVVAVGWSFEKGALLFTYVAIRGYNWLCAVDRKVRDMMRDTKE